MGAGDHLTEVWQIEWRNVVWGGATSDVRLTDLSGWLEKPSLRGSNPDRPGRHGQFPGRKYSEGRTVEVELTVFADDDDFTTLRSLEDAFSYAEDPAEEELAIWAGTEQPHMIRARLEKVAVPTDHEWSVGYHRVRCQWVASDPNRYVHWVAVSPVLGMPGGASTGITFPITFPITFGTGVSSGSLTLWNGGNAPAWPTFTLTGTLVAPTIMRTDTGQKLQFAPSYTLLDGETMTIDTYDRTVTIAGVSRRDQLIVADWFSLPPQRDTVITLSSTGAYDSSAGLTSSHYWTYL